MFAHPYDSSLTPAPVCTHPPTLGRLSETPRPPLQPTQRARVAAVCFARGYQPLTLETFQDQGPLDIHRVGEPRPAPPEAGGTNLCSQKQGSDNNAIDEEDPVQQVAEFRIEQAEALCRCVKR